jgi:membrane protease YdiL (CAAX protease family)
MSSVTGDDQSFWSYEDLALFIGAVFPSFAIALLAIRPLHLSSEGLRTMAFQSILYALLLGTLYALIAVRYRRPFWRSLGFTFSFRYVWLYIAIGPVLAAAWVSLGVALRAPSEPVIQNLVTDRLSRIVVMLFVSILGPVFEELVFRGFLLPLLARSLGPWAAIFLTAAPFALLHGVQYRWAWQSMLIVGIAGIIFGIARVKTGSTAAAALIHVGYNSTLFGLFLLQQ